MGAKAVAGTPVPHAVKALGIGTRLIGFHQILAGTKKHHHIRLRCIADARMADDLRLCGDGLGIASRIDSMKQRLTAMRNAPGCGTGAAEVKGPEPPVQAAGVDPVGNSVGIKVNDRRGRQPVRVGRRPRSGGNAQVVRAIGPAAVQAAVKIKHEEFCVTIAGVAVAVTDDGCPFAVVQKCDGRLAEGIAKIGVIGVTELPKHGLRRLD